MAFRAKSKSNSFLQNNNSKSRFTAKSLGKPINERTTLTINNGQIHIVESRNDKILALQEVGNDHNKTGSKPLTSRNTIINNIRTNSSDSIAQFISKAKIANSSGLADYIAKIITDGNTVSIPLPNLNAKDSIAAFITNLQQQSSIQLPAIPDASNPVFAVQQSRDQAIFNALVASMSIKNPTISAFLEPGKTTTTTGGNNGSGIQIEEKIVTGETLPDEFSQNPFVDMSIDNAQTNDVLVWNGNTWSNGKAPLKVSELLDTTITNLQVNQALIWDGLKWSNMTIALGGPTPIESLSNVASAPDPNNPAHYLGWDNNLKRWINRRIDVSEIANLVLSSGASILDDLNDVIISAPNPNEILKFSGTFWTNQTIGNIDILDNVTITTPLDGQMLYYNGANWINRNVKEIINLTDLVDATITSPTTGQVLQYNGSQWANVTLPSVGQLKTWLITDIRSSGIYGGQAIIDTWTTRTLNSLDINSGANVLFAANQITIEAGSYNIEINIPFYRTGLTKIRLRNITDATNLTESHAMFINDGATLNISTHCLVTSTKVMEIQYYASNTIDESDLGVPMGIGNEMYTMIRISRLLTTSLVWHFSDTRLLSVVGGIATKNAWTRRAFNTINTADGSEITIFDSIFTIMPGSYHVDIIACFYKTKHTKLRFRNITTNLNVAQSVNNYSCEDATIRFNFTLDATVTYNYELQYYVTHADSNIDLGIPSGLDQEIYATIRFTRF